MNKIHFRNHLNNFVGEGYGYIPRWAARVYGEADWENIRKVLTEWQDLGYLDIIKDPEMCDDNEYFLKMYNFVDASKPLPPEWLSYNRTPPLM